MKKRFNCLRCNKRLKATQVMFCSSSCARRYVVHKKGQDNLQITCIICGTVFTTSRYRYEHSNPKCCSRKCMGIWQSKNRVPWNKQARIMKHCSECGKEFSYLANTTRKHPKKFCSHACYSLSLKNKIPWNKLVSVVKICLHCGKEFHGSPKHTIKKKYCSKICAGAASRGHVSWSRGLDKSDSRVAKWSGSNHGNWKGGVVRYHYPAIFKYARKERRKIDNFTCQECRQTEQQLGYPLSVHHIDYNKQNNELYNLISLCKSCHAQTNFKRDDWAKYFKNLNK